MLSEQIDALVALRPVFMVSAAMALGAYIGARDPGHTDTEHTSERPDNGPSKTDHAA